MMHPADHDCKLWPPAVWERLSQVIPTVIITVPPEDADKAKDV